MSSEDYLNSRVETFKLYPTSTLISHAKNLVKSYLGCSSCHASRRDLVWMVEYFQSSSFIECHDLNNITEHYVRGLELLAKIEYEAQTSLNNSVSSSVKNSIQTLEEKAGCID